MIQENVEALIVLILGITRYLDKARIHSALIICSIVPFEDEFALNWQFLTYIYPNVFIILATIPPIPASPIFQKESQHVEVRILSQL